MGGGKREVLERKKKCESVRGYPELTACFFRRCVFPSPVKKITQSILGDTFQHCVVAWWEYNGQTEFFASAQEARRVRCAIKSGLA
jgi:hypothetical protein